MPRRRRKPSRRQINIGFSPLDYGRVHEAARVGGVTGMAFALNAAEGHPALLAWLMAAVLYARRAAMRTAPVGHQ